MSTVHEKSVRLGVRTGLWGESGGSGENGEMWRECGESGEGTWAMAMWNLLRSSFDEQLNTGTASKVLP
jgi:hypothetical protein